MHATSPRRSCSIPRRRIDASRDPGRHRGDRPPGRAAFVVQQLHQLHDATRQVAGQAGGAQVDGARTVATLNIGGSLATTVSFVVTSE